MNMKKNKIAALAIAGALSLGTLSGVSVAQADSGHSVGGPEAAVASVLASLVTKGTITQAQSDAITAALKAAVPAAGLKPGKDGMGIGGIGANTAARQAVITSFLGKTAAELQTAHQAGKSLATVATEAGKSPADLIAALVKYDNAQIDAAVTAGTITADNAAKIKANVTARVTDQVNNVRPAMGPKGDGDDKGRKGGKGHKDGDDSSAKSGSTGTLNTQGTLNTNGASSKKATGTTKKVVKKVTTVSSKKANG